MNRIGSGSVDGRNPYQMNKKKWSNLSSLSTSRTRLWWNDLGRQVVGFDFAAFIEDELKDEPVSDEIWRLSAIWSRGSKESLP